jgi:transcriptional regulator with XRE-family HTH domain
VPARLSPPTCAASANVRSSQEALGEAASLDMSEISRLERAHRDPRLATIAKLARALGVPAARLLEGID